MSNYDIFPEQIDQADCPNPVLDESSPNNQVDPDLQQEIDHYGQVGINVFLVNIKSMREEGYIITDDMSDGDFTATVDAYVEDLMTTCGIKSQDALVLVRVFGDKATNIGASGSQAVYENSNWQDFDNFVGDFYNGVVGADPSTVQDAAALALNNFYQVEFKKESSSPQVGTPEVGVEPKDSTDTSLPPIVAPMIGILALAGATFAIVKGFERRKEGKTLLHEVENMLKDQNLRVKKAFIQEETDDNLKDPISDGEAKFIEDMPKSDIPEITMLQKAIEDGYPGWKLTVEEIEKGLFEARGFSPDKSILNKLKRTLNPETNIYLKNITGLEEEIASIINKKSDLLSRLGELGTKLETLKAETAKLTMSDQVNAGIEGQSGVYTMPSLVEKLAKIKLAYQQAYDMHIVDKKVNEPFRLIPDINESLDQLIELTRSIPEIHQDINATYAELDPLFALITEQQEDAQVSVTDLTDNYHENCLGSSLEDFKDMQTQLSLIEELKNKLANPNTTFNVDELLEIRATLSAIAKHKKRFDTGFDAIRTHVINIKEIESQSTQDIQEISDIFQNAEDYIDDNRTFIDDETEDEFEPYYEKLEALQSQRDDEKPDYVKLEQAIQSLKDESRQYLEKIKAEHEEILSLEQYIQGATSDFEVEFSNLSTYEHDSDVDSQTKEDIREAEDDIDAVKTRPLSPTAENRAALREQKKHLVTAKKLLVELKRDAQDDKALEEQKREQIRQQLLEAERQRQRAEQARIDAAERAREQAESHARMDSYSSPSHARHDGGGSHTRRG